VLIGVGLYDFTGSYNIVWYISIGLGIFGAIINYPIQEKPILKVAGQRI
jgi:uncharacterized membrane protein